MKAMKDKAARIIATCEFVNESSNGTWCNCFYRSANGCLYNIQTKDGKLYDVISYGR